jgi:hypothetical protein
VSRHGHGLGFPSAFPWPQWFWKAMGVSGGAVVTSGTQWRSRVTRGAVESSGKERRGPGSFLPVFHVSRPGSGQGRLGINNQVREGVHGYGYRARAYDSGVTHSEFGFPNFCPERVRHNARMKLNFENLKSATVGCQDIS